MEQPKKEVCSIRIMFPVDSDDEAIAIKKKIKDILSGSPEAIIQFSINSAPTDRSMVR